nr:solute carrier organic anion transporter family member 4A1-like [Ciona intestinalis]|eukprot:XP_026695438.1 solute carrier organic anion transporter family member 4A1-like [Ciona intestinalis]
MAGVNVPYAGQSSDAPLQPQLPVHPCNENCSCKINSFAPVCGFDGVTYYSSCFAGCKLHVASNGEKIFSNCTCIPPMQKNNNSNHVITEGKAYPGKCFKICWWQNLILVGLFFVIGTTFMCAVPGVDLSLRCFPQHLRSLAVGVQWILIRTLGTIPGPIIFGAMIDSTCQIWNKRDLCAEGLGSCVMYKNQELSFSLLILSVIYKGASILFFGLALLSYKPARLVATESSPSHHRVTESPM